MTKFVIGWGFTLAYLIALVVFVAVKANTPYVTPENSGAVWNVWELLKIASMGAGLWASGWIVGTTARRAQ